MGSAPAGPLQGVLDLDSGQLARFPKEPAMNRTDTPLDGMLRHLGAAYYDSLHGRIAPAEVVRALDCVAERVHELPAGMLVAAGPHAAGRHHHDLWHGRVRDIMTTAVVTVTSSASYQQLAALLAEREISGVPVLTDGGHVAGVVSHVDLIAAGELQIGRPLHRPARRQLRLTAGQLMTAPAVTVLPDATIAAAARLMSDRHVRRLPVVDAGGRLTGIVSLRDLLSPFACSDAEIGWQVTEMLAQILPADPAGIRVTVDGGIVRLAGVTTLAGRPDLLTLAARLTWDIDGVVDVVSAPAAASPPVPAQHG
jgi:CBS domain-containing protein